MIILDSEEIISRSLTRLVKQRAPVSPGHNVAAVQLLHQVTEDGCLGVGRQGVKRFGPQRVAHVCIVAVRLQEDAKNF